MFLKVHVKPNSDKVLIFRKEGRIIVYLKNEAEKNKANLELCNKLGKFFGKQIRIVKGLHSRNKVIEVQLNEEELNLFF